MNLRRHRTEPPRIDITPLIDVVFLMLIFFMVSTTFDKQTQLKVDLPSASTVVEKSEEPETIEIKIDRSGHFYVNEQELVQHDAETLKRAVQKIADGRLELPVLVSGDRNAPLQAMMTVMDIVAQLGMSQLSFVAKQEATDKARE